MVSFDLSSEIKGYSPRNLDGVIQFCKIGDAQVVNFEEPEPSIDEENKDNEDNKIIVQGKSRDSGDSEEEESDENEDQEWWF